MQSESIDQLATALAKAQSEMKLPGKNREVTVRLKDNKGQYKFEYTTLDHMIEHVRPHLTANGLWFIQTVGSDNGKSVLDTMLTHASGQWVTGRMPIITGSGDNAAQVFGSAVTYMRRYALAALLGIASEEDDDANAADGNTIAEKRDRLPPVGNGTYAAAQAKRPVAAPPTDEAKKWADKATVAVKAFETQRGLTAWEQRQRPALDRLKAIEPEIYTEVEHVIAEQYAKLSTLNA